MHITAAERRALWVLAVVFATGAAVRFFLADPPPPLPRPSPAPFAGPATFDSLFVDDRLDVNAAGIDHLVLLPGIGPAIAARIEASKRHDGPFRSIDDLQRVRGIGPKTTERLKSIATVRASSISSEEPAGFEHPGADR